MKFRNIEKTYDVYVNEQNIVSDYDGDQTYIIDYTKYMADLNNDSYILDIGCRDGRWINRLEKKYHNIYGIDIGDASYKNSIKKYGEEWTKNHIFKGDIQENILIKQLSDMKFDFINFSHTIEHLNNPDQALKNIRNLMKDESKILIIIPADLIKFKTLELAMKNQPYHEIFWESTEDVKDYLKNNGFEIIKCEEFFNIGLSGEWRILCKKNI
jgi:SAM-dependent methyltransferase